MTIKHLFPTAKPTVDFNFAAERELDPRIAFTRDSIGSYVDAQGIVRYAAENEPRFDHNGGTGESLGLLIEEKRTNLIVNSQVFETGYSVGELTITDNAAVAPDGTTTAASILETANNAFHSFQLSSTSQTDLSQSIFVKPNGRDNICLRFVTTGGDWYTITFNLTGNGSITQETPGSLSNWTINSKSIAKLSNGWYRISAGATTTAATTYMFTVLGSDSPTPALALDYGYPRYVGDITKGYYVWGAQVEANSFPTSYIPTNGALNGEDRAQDIVDITGTNFSSWWNSSEGSIVTVAHNFPTKGSMKAWEFNDESIKASGPTLVASSTSFQSPIAGSYTNSTINFGSIKTKTAFTFTTNGFIAGSGDGSDVQTNTSGLDPNVARVNIGRGRGNYGEVLNGTIALLAYYPRRLSDEQLVSLTA